MHAQYLELVPINGLGSYKDNDRQNSPEVQLERVDVIQRKSGYTL